MLKKFVLLSFLLLFNSAVAGSNYKKEIAHLLTYVKTTQCQYVRNGDMHNGQSAAKHIKSKYDYFKSDITSAEDFIRLSATKSTMSGNLYYIKCVGSPKIKSSKWLLEELNRYRESQTK